MIWKSAHDRSTLSVRPKWDGLAPLTPITPRGVASSTMIVALYFSQFHNYGQVYDITFHGKYSIYDNQFDTVRGTVF